jgi:hypothetical protein
MLSGPGPFLCAAAVVVVQSGNCSATELPEHEALRAGLEPATCRLGGDNRSRSGPQQDETSRSWGAVGFAGSNRRPEGPLPKR